MKGDGVNNGESAEFRSDLIHAKHENLILKTELLHSIQQHEREIKQMQLAQEAKIKAIEAASAKAKTPNLNAFENAAKEQNQLHLENLQLNQKLQMCEEELTAVDGRLNALRAQEADKIKLWERKLAEKEDQTSLLEARVAESISRMSSLEVDLQKEKLLRQELEFTLNSERHEMKMLQSQLGDVENDCKNQVIEMADEVSRCKQRLRDAEATNKSRVEDLMEKLEREEDCHRDTKCEMSSAVCQMEAKLSSLKKRHLEEIAKLLQENNSLLDHIEGIEQGRMVNGSSFVAAEKERVDCLNAELETKVTELHEAQKKMTSLESQVTSQDDFKALFNRERESLGLLRREHDELLRKTKSADEDLSRMCSEMDCLKRSVMEKDKLLNELSSEILKKSGDFRQVQTELEVTLNEQKELNRAKISALENRLQRKGEECAKKQREAKEKIKKYGLLIKKLRFRVEKFRVKEKEREAARLTADEDFGSATKFKELQFLTQSVMHRHVEFKAFLDEFKLKHGSESKVDDWFCKVGSVGEKFAELEAAQSEAYSALESL